MHVFEYVLTCSNQMNSCWFFLDIPLSMHEFLVHIDFGQRHTSRSGQLWRQVLFKSWGDPRICTTDYKTGKPSVHIEENGIYMFHSICILSRPRHSILNAKTSQEIALTDVEHSCFDCLFPAVKFETKYDHFQEPLGLEHQIPKSVLLLSTFVLWHCIEEILISCQNCGWLCALKNCS